MNDVRSPLTPQIWLYDLFSSKAAMRGEVIRRKKRDVERFVGMTLFHNEIERRGYRVVENSGNFIIFCNQEPVRWVINPERVVSLKETTMKSF